MDVFTKIIDPLIGREGGYSNHGSDRGGETNWGITVARARAAGYSGLMRDMTREQAVQIYRLYYWIQPGYDRIAEIDEALAEKMLDTGVNCGTGTASRWLQRVLNVLNARGTIYPDLVVDGAVGGMTRAAIQALYKRRGKDAGSQVLVAGVTVLQGVHYITLAEKDPSQEDFAFGWLKNRILL